MELVNTFEIKGLGADAIKGLKPTAKKELDMIPELLRAFVHRKPPVIRVRTHTYRALRKHLEEHLEDETALVYEGIQILPEFAGMQ